MKLCRADAASRSASSSTPTTSPRGVSTGMCRRPHSSISISTLSAVRSAVTVRAGALITDAIGTSTGRPAATTRVRRSRSVKMPRRAVGQPDERVGHVVLGHLHHDVAHRIRRIDRQHVAVHELGDGPAVGRGGDGRPVRTAAAPAGGGQESQTRRLGELRPHRCAGQSDQGARHGGAGLEIHSRAGQQRHVAEDAPRFDDVDQGAVAAGPQGHRAVADHPDLIGHPGRVVGDDDSGGELLYRRPGGELGEFGLRRSLERGVVGQERREAGSVKRF